jgi:hypothetical protein
MLFPTHKSDTPWSPEFSKGWEALAGYRKQERGGRKKGGGAQATPALYPAIPEREGTLVLPALTPDLFIK